MPKENTYNCADCANRQTPICDSCHFIEHPNGDDSKPDHYVDANAIGVDNKKIREMAHLIAVRLATGRPVYTNWIMRYNEAVIDGGNEDG